MRRPILLIFLGRAVNQGGIFVFLVAPAIGLDDRSYNQLTIATTIGILFVTAPMGALGQHLVRIQRFVTRPLHGIRPLLTLAAAGGTVAFLTGAIWVGSTIWLGLIVIASVMAGVAAWGATALAVHDVPARSAALDGLSGITLVSVAAVLVQGDRSTTSWATGYVIAWVLPCASALWLLVRLRPAPPHETMETVPSQWRVLIGSTRLVLIGVAAMAFNRLDYLILAAVGDEREAARYALAARFVGPALVALGSLNNSLYPHQLRLVDDPETLKSHTDRMSRRAATLSVAAGAASVAGAAMVSAVFDDIGARDPVLPTALLALSVVVYAYAIPMSFALVSIGSERSWLRILVAATAIDALAVLWLGHQGATAVALIWFGIQIGVAAFVTRSYRGDFARRITTAAAR